MTNASLAGMSLMTKGLITTVCGLAGGVCGADAVFVTIKLMQHIHTRDEQ